MAVLAVYERWCPISNSFGIAVMADPEMFLTRVQTGLEGLLGEDGRGGVCSVQTGNHGASFPPDSRR